MTSVIQVENISKQYRLGMVGGSTIASDIQRFMAKIRGKEDPTLKIGVENKLDTTDGDYVWALHDINFKVEQGEVLGIIGKNGAGKSTLLKILSKVTTPTIGSIKIKGRIASLLEVGTGFHPELSGRENIFLNGAILGMAKTEIRSKFDEIVDFSGVERYIDTPVKRYSSGMYVRLAFAVAAHLESEILILDEVLAVGDAEFQKKCLGKMGDVAIGGRTVLFVSHNISAIKSLCRRAILLSQGILTSDGLVSEVIEKYTENYQELLPERIFEPPKSAHFIFFVNKITIENNEGIPSASLNCNTNWRIRISFQVFEKIPYFIAGIGISTIADFPLNTTWTSPVDIEKGNYEVVFDKCMLQLAPGKYKLTVGFSSREQNLQYLENVAIFEFQEIFDKNQFVNTKSGVLLNQMSNKIISII